MALSGAGTRDFEEISKLEYDGESNERFSLPSAASFTWTSRAGGFRNDRAGKLATTAQEQFVAQKKGFEKSVANT
ncbi:unnamed protein product [Notodromas monacha]|uniref:Uncharacterized protein n=1 Tax=Notodromas monacha TaxID=399045 RepID=A0A7R9BKM8_9CRUS|nr:unnamed protein product [Notodromas monacha]CAG0915722.1 unnamed protein product [Notodromas monacha]